MINTSEILQTVHMITEEKLDIRTITMGISLYSCAHPDKKELERRIYDTITTGQSAWYRWARSWSGNLASPLSTSAFP